MVADSWAAPSVVRALDSGDGRVAEPLTPRPAGPVPGVRVGQGDEGAQVTPGSEAARGGPTLRARVARMGFGPTASNEVWELGGGSIAQRARFRRIMDILFEKGFASVDELVGELSVSRMTVHRDLDELDSRGALRKVRGGATVGRTEQFESSWEYRTRIAVDKKIAIARRALDYVEPGSSLCIDGSSTVHELTKLLAAKTPLTVVTASLPALGELALVPGVELHSVAGEYDPHFRTFMGARAEQSIRQMRVDTAFISMAAIAGTTVCHSQAKAIELNRAFFDIAKTRILLVDSTKFGHSAIHVFSEISDWDLVITDSEAPAEDVEVLRSAGVQVDLVDVATGSATS